MYEAELCRLRGGRLLRDARDRADVEAAEMCFEQALAIARQQEALSLELRATMSLARLHRDRTKHVPLRDVIFPISERFEEGFDTVDLREAQGLLGLPRIHSLSSPSYTTSSAKSRPSHGGM